MSPPPRRSSARPTPTSAPRAAFLPDISLTGAYGSASAALDGLFKSGSSAWSFAPALTLPLFTAGRNAGNLDLAEARRTEAVAVYEQTIQQAFRDVSDALARRRQLAAQIEDTQVVLAALTERARLADLRFGAGRSTYLEILDAQRDLFETEQALVQLRRAHLASGVAPRWPARKRPTTTAPMAGSRGRRPPIVSANM